jgi:WD40 repeat protein
VNQLFAEAANMTAGGDSLPLLSLTLYRMYRDYHSSGTLTLAQFTEMGGMSSVVQNEIDRLLSKDPDTRRTELELLKSAFVPWLATVSDNNEPLRRIALWSDISEPSRDVVSRFVDARLLVRDRRALGTDASEYHDVVEVALESLLRQWPDLARWLAEQRVDLRAADDLMREANAWEAHDRDGAYLYEGTLLTTAEALCSSTTFARQLEPARDFVAASRRRESERHEETRRHAEAELQATRDRLAAAREQQQITGRHTAVLRRRDRILRSVLALTVVVALAAAAGFVWARHSQGVAERSARDATAQKLVAEAQSLLADSRQGDDVQALEELLAADKLANTPDDRPLLDAVVDRYSMRKVLITKEPVIAVASASGGHRLAMAEPAGIRIWDTARAGWQDSIASAATTLSDAGTKLTGMAISPDGQTVAAGTEEGSVRVWDVRDPTAESRAVGTKHNGRVTTVAISSNGLIASAGVDGMIDIWSSVAHQAMPPIRGVSEIFAIAFTPSGNRFAVGRADGTIQLFDVVGPVAVEAPTRRDAHPGGVMGLAFSPDGRLLASGGADSHVRSWNAESLAPVRDMAGHTATVTDVAFNADSTRIASGGNDKTVQMWDVASGGRIGDPMRGHGGLVLSVDFTDDGSEIVSGGNEHTMRLWDATIGQPISTPLTSNTGPIADVAFTPDGSEIVSGGADDTVRVWSADTGAEVERMSEHTGVVSSVAVSPVDGAVASASADGTVLLWRRSGGDVSRFDAGRPLTSVAFSPNGEAMAAGGVDGQIVVWDLTSGQRRLLENKDRAIVYDVAFDSNNERLASVSASGHLRMWRLADGGQLWERKPVDELPEAVKAKETLAEGFPGALISVAFSPDGRRVAAGGVDWTTEGGAVGFLQRWNVDDGAPTGQPIKVGNAVMGIAFRPQQTQTTGDAIVVASFDPYEVQLWDTDNPGEAQFIFAGHQAQVVSVAISPDNRRIISGSADGTVRIWPNLPITPADVAICSKLTSNMTEGQWAAWISEEIPYQQSCPDMSEPLAARPN